ncbi:MAG: RidA family protein [candidate division Zixibacteria bacterium]|nr:RidA family protein [candidate division Zixibacteria bacterium]
MPRQNIPSGSPYEPTIGFSRAVRIGNLVAVSGTAPIGKDKAAVGKGDAYVQTKRCIEIIREALEKAGARLEDVIRTRTYLTDTKNWEAVARAHGEVFGNIRPASTFIEVSRFIDKDWLVELEADAYLQD